MISINLAHEPRAGPGSGPDRASAQIGYDILAQGRAPVFRLAAEVALRHHEKWDGSGYPGALVGEAIPESARIVALADVFDALSMKRPYKEAWPLDRIMDTIRSGSESHFDPLLVGLFTGILPRILEVRAEWARREIEEGGSGSLFGEL